MHNPARNPDCVFCDLSNDQVLMENDLTFAIRDNHPVTQYHTLVIPRRHIASFFELTGPELTAVYDLLGRLRQDVRARDASITGFNIGVNEGRSAGQTVFHVHFHFIPRRDGDVRNPRGGVRHVQPDRGYD